ncbi:MAG TPA: maltose alpha-D-glucosyltransferase [Candidatus Methanoperedens sp.]|nr:maltose alpha-D-glucosyltransferase [Candidatus Methanoperedens sp.]HLB71730.1 maltose alpha-D-glucosyltransferase [Candidatus Methanoperedens sp.]
MSGKRIDLEDAPQWYKDAIIYEVHVRSFYDSDGDGIGDFNGLTEKLDYLRDLGITAIWLLPFYPSPLKDDGYDISDYFGIHPSYGTLKDFKRFLKEAHKKGIRVITELVLNHTSDQHPWFQKARKAKQGSPWRDYYVWSDSTDKYKDARIIFKDFEFSNWAWDSMQKAYFWHRFYSHQPDLNYENPLVREAVFKVIDYWMDAGVDGMRLDAVPYLFEKEGTNCENLPETYEFLKKLREHIDIEYRGKMLLAEANQWPEDAVAYFGNGDECHMAFHFPLMPRMFMALKMEDRFPIIDILEQTPAIPEICQWALFLRNHDELTLEMVTDEERDYMYRMYAQDPQTRINLGIRRRLAPLMGNHRRRMELMNSLLFSLPGTPVIYYGDEIGMGDNIYLGDRNGVRTPMHWSADKNAGFSRSNPQKLYLPVIIDPEYHYEAFNVDAQQNNPYSFLWWMKRLISMRKRFKAFGRGTLEFLYPENRKVLAFLRRYQDECILVLANLSRFVQYVELNLSDFKGKIPVELYGRTAFPPIGDQPYIVTLGPHAFYWFSIEPKLAGEALPGIPTLFIADDLKKIFLDETKGELENFLPAYLQARRWFGGKARTIQSAKIYEFVSILQKTSRFCITLVRVEYIEGAPETYSLPLAFAFGEQAHVVQEKHPQAVIARLNGRDGEGVIYDAMAEKNFGNVLIDAIAHRRFFKGNKDRVHATPTRAFRKYLEQTETFPEPVLLSADHSNTMVVYGDKFVLKFFRRLEEGSNPDLEIGRFLTEKRSFVHVPQIYGALEYSRHNGIPVTLAVLQGYVPNQGNAWSFTQDALTQYFERALSIQIEVKEVPLPHKPLMELIDAEIPLLARETIGTYIDAVQLLGKRTAELHMALASDPEDPDFAPEAFSELYQRSIYHSMYSLTKDVFQLMRKRITNVPENVRVEAQKVLGLESEILKRFRSVLERRMTAVRIRCHGDYHLGQVLRTGNDFVIIDFEGEPARSLSERRLKRSPFRDVAGMIRSFHYAAYTMLLDKGSIRPEDIPALDRWADQWYTYVGVIFMKSYLDQSRDAIFIPEDRKEIRVLLSVFLLEKAVYELGYELNNRPDWIIIPLKGILRLLEE